MLQSQAKLWNRGRGGRGGREGGWRGRIRSRRGGRRERLKRE